MVRKYWRLECLAAMTILRTVSTNVSASYQRGDTESRGLVWCELTVHVWSIGWVEGVDHHIDGLEGFDQFGDGGVGDVESMRRVAVVFPDLARVARYAYHIVATAIEKFVDHI